jgi:hypothetical protein
MGVVQSRQMNKRKEPFQNMKGKNVLIIIIIIELSATHFHVPPYWALALRLAERYQNSKIQTVINCQ